MNYTDVETLKTRLEIEDGDHDHDLTLQSILEAVSRMIDNYTHRRFYTATETRYYTPVSRVEAFIDDCVSVTAVVTDDNADRTYPSTWSATDYDLEPYNAALDGKPYTTICVAENSTKEFPVVKKGLKITGAFGYCTSTNIPDPIVEACNLQSERVYKRKDAPFGVMGSADMGTVTVIPKLDPDVKMLLDPYKRLV